MFREVGGGGRLDLKLDDENGIATVTIHNPERRNSLTGKMMAEFADIQETLSCWEEGVCVVLRGSGNTFCAGADLSVARDRLASNAAGELMCTLMTDTLNRWRRMPLISVAAIEGAAVGGGAELSTVCDHRVMHHSALVKFVHTRMGVTPGWGGGGRLTRLVGRQAALRLLAGGNKLGAEEALRIGYVDGITEERSGEHEGQGEDVLDETVRAFYEQYLVGSRAAVRGAKTLIAAADDETLESALLVERRVFGSLWGGEDNRLALEKSAFGRK